MFVEIDRRPLFIIVGEKIFTPLIYIILFISFLVIISGEKFAELNIGGKKTLLIFLICVSLWIGQIIPIGITGLLALVLLPLFGVMSANEAYSLFGNNAVFFLMGVFILGSAIKTTGLAGRIALFFMNRFGNTPDSLLITLYSFTFLMSWFMPEHVVAAIAFPIVLEIARNLKLSTKSGYGKILFLALAWGCVTGGVATFLGGARVPLAAGILQKTTGESITFLEWFLFGGPASIAIALPGILILKLFFKYKDIDLSLTKSSLQRMLYEQGLITFKEQLTGLITAGTIVAWIGWGHHLGLANIAIISTVLLFIFRLIKWRDIQDNVNWGVILMYGGAIALGEALQKSGASKYVAENILFGNLINPFAITVLLTILTLSLTAVMSNSATVAALLPIAIAVGSSVSINPKSITLIVAFISGIDFVLPIGTPASAIAYSSGYLKIRDMLLPGILMSAIAVAIFLLLYSYYLPVIWYNG